MLVSAFLCGSVSVYIWCCLRHRLVCLSVFRCLCLLVCLCLFKCILNICLSVCFSVCFSPLTLSCRQPKEEMIHVLAKYFFHHHSFICRRLKYPPSLFSAPEATDSNPIEKQRRLSTFK